jgi:hypothetical protein
VKGTLIVFISTVTELSIMKLFNQNELQAINNIMTPYGVLEKMWDENDLLYSLSVPVFLAIKMTPILHPPYSHTYDGVTSFPILHMALRE